MVAAAVLAVAGCASWPPSWLPATWLPANRPSARLLADADRSFTEGKYQEALDAYDEILAKYPETDEAPRAGARREPLADLLAARTQITRLSAAMRAQESELARLRGEISRSRQQILRLTDETDRLRADLEQLKRIDIDLERRHK